MKFVSPIPAILSRVAEPIEPTTTSDLEVLQSTQFPFLLIPLPLSDTIASGAGLRLSRSTLFHVSGQLTNPAAAVTTNLFTLDRGIWRIRGTVHYEANYLAFATGLQVGIVFSPSVVVNRLYQNFPINGNRVSSFEHLITLDVDTAFVQTFLAAPPAAGNSHSFFLQLGLEKLL